MLNFMESIFISAPTSPRLSNDDHARLRQVSRGGGGAAQEQQSGGGNLSGQHFENCTEYGSLPAFIWNLISSSFLAQNNCTSPFLLLICYVRTMIHMPHMLLCYAVCIYVFSLLNRSRPKRL